ncbi:MAG: hypothetical protein ACXACK_12525 [Candidatus Hodarchaeales archaeon]
MFLVVFILALVPMLSVSAKKPLIGAMDLQFNLSWPGPQQTDYPDWVGNVTIGENLYGMAFYAIGSGKPFGDKVTGSAFFFEEIWEIYEVGTLEYEFDEFGNIVHETYVKGEIVLWGYDAGLTNLKNSKYHMTGTVEYDALFGMTGRHVYMSGDILWYPFEAPYAAPGTLRIN